MQAVAERLQRAKSAAIVAYRGLTVVATEKLRRQLRESDGELIMVKKTLLRRVLETGDLGEALGDAEGSLALAFSYRDEVSAAKILAAFMRENPDIIVLGGGVLGSSALSAQQVATLASLPGRPELLAKLLGTISAPISGFVGVLHGTLSKFVRTVEAVRVAKAAS